MKITIHRGSNQIGGCITEYEIDGWKLFVDFGEQLPGATISDKPLEIEGLTYGDFSKSTLLITHYHGDHIGKIADADPNVPVYMGHIAHDIYCKLQRHLAFIDGEAGEKAKAILNRCRNVKTFLDREKFSFGPFVIEPVKMDHSAYDAYGFVIGNSTDEEDIVFQTGDFRAHGIFGVEFHEKITNLPVVKAIVCEGTNIERDTTPAGQVDSIEHRFEELFKQNKYNVVFVSSTNIDRLFDIYRAAASSGHPIFMDEYQFDVLNSVIGESYWSRNDLEYDTVTDENEEEESYQSESVYEFDKGAPIVLRYDHSSKDTPKFFIPQQMRRLINWKGCVLIARTTPQFLFLIDTFPKDKTKKYLSMWEGYLNPDSPAYNEKLAAALGPDYEYIHMSGHADTHTLKELFWTVDAEMIIPMHTNNPQKFLEIFPEDEWHIRLAADGETIDLDSE